MVNSGDKLTTLIRSLGPDDASFQAGANASVQEREQRWPLFKSVSLVRLESTPELSAQERQRWSKLEKTDLGMARKPALSLPTFDDELTISLSKIAEKAAPSTVKPRGHIEQISGGSGFKGDRHEEPQPLASDHLNASDILPAPSHQTHIMQTPELLSMPVVAMNLEIEPRSSMGGHHDVPQQIASNDLKAQDVSPVPIHQTQIMQTPEFLRMPVDAMNLEIEPDSMGEVSALKTDDISELSDTKHNDDSLQSLFGRIKAKESVVVKPAEKRFSFFDRLKKR